MLRNATSVFLVPDIADQAGHASFVATCGVEGTDCSKGKSQRFRLIQVEPINSICVGADSICVGAEQILPSTPVNGD